MTVIVVDDEKLSQNRLMKAVRAADPYADIYPFDSSLDAYEFLLTHPCDVAVLDIMGMDVDGITIAQKMAEKAPRLNIIFATGYTEFALDAFEVNASAYLMKPVTDEAMKKAFTSLRFQSEVKTGEFYVKCFGNFGIFYNARPVHFHRAKTKELFAYLFDRRGVGCTGKEIMCALWEDEGHESYYKQLRKDLFDTLTELGLERLIIRDTGTIAIAHDEIESDLKSYLNGSAEAQKAYNGDYMLQYSWAENTNAWLQQNRR